MSYVDSAGNKLTLVPERVKKVVSGPPTGSFPIGTAILLGLAFYTIIQAYLTQNLGGYLSNWIFALVLTFLVYILWGGRLQSGVKGRGGQFAFAILVAALLYLAPTIVSWLAGVGIKIALIPLATVGGVNFSFQINGVDVTWLLAVIVLLTLYYGRHDLKDWVHGDFHL